MLSRNLPSFCIVTAIASLPNFLFFKLHEVGAGPPLPPHLPWVSSCSLVLSALSQAIVLFAAFEDCLS
jgi:hypothetical protein